MNPASAEDMERGNVLGVDVSAIAMADAIATLERWIAEGRREYVCVTGVHGIMECRRDAALRQIHNAAGMVTPDGVPLVYFLRLTGKKHTQRVYGPDLMREMTALSGERGYRHFYYGGDVGVAEKLKEVLVRSVPGLRVVGTLCPPFRALTVEEDRAVVDVINAARPDIVWVGLSTPKQERWMAAHLGRIEAPVMIGVGAAFDFLAGTKRQAPRWMQRHALEWLFRLCSEPRRLWRRYAYIVPGFAFLAAGELLRRAVHRSSSAPDALSRDYR
ncbi:WecB/TagA/CpsF family glycosyltransferase [Bradyrhizobium sp. 2TAF24]|uniref:WecB/TagA/CpsF family glycosyltransferase n=1 Tax=Bradyrhizobium sp. 2TAF24 TaxID=3233011 RepID=UPI003F91A3AD